MSEKALEFTTPDNKAEGETNNTEQGIVYPPEIKAKLDLAMDKITKTEKGSAEELIALQAYQEEINSLTKAREEKEAHDKEMMELVDFEGVQIHKFELEALKDLILQINKGFAQQRIINKDFKAEDINLADLKIIIEDNKVIQIKSITTVLSGDISKAIEALISLKYLDLASLSSAEGLILPSTLNATLYLDSLSSAEGLTLPTTVKGDLNLFSLKSAEGLILPTTLNGYLNLYSLSSAEGLVLPTTVNGDLSLSGLTSVEGLVLPITVNGYLSLGGLTSAEGLTLPTKVKGNLYLNSLTSVEGLVLPTTLNGSLDLNSLNSAERNELRRKHPSFEIYPED
jgi:predicted HTH domain antitoxin